MAIMKYETKLTLYSSYFDLNERLTPKSILGIFQDIAARQAEDIGVGFQTMLNKNLYWVLSRVKYDIIKMPYPDQVVTATTWPHEKGRIDFDRDMLITDENGEILVKATSKWCIIDTIQRKLQRTETINYIGEIYTDVNYTERFDKITLPNIDLQKIFSHKVQFSDLDHNKHMNNTNYGSIVLNAIKNKIFTHFEINFLNECLLDDSISIFVSNTESEEYITGKVQDKIVFNAFVK